MPGELCDGLKAILFVMGRRFESDEPGVLFFPQFLQTTTDIEEGTTKKKDKLSGGQIAGIVIGTLVGVALLIALGYVSLS